MFRLKYAARAALLLAVAACTGDVTAPAAPGGAGPAQTISDAAHAGTVPGFYFLPPMVPAPSYSGTFDGGLQPRVEICEINGPSCTTIATYNNVPAGNGSYQVNWHTNQFNLDPAKTYRISVFVGTFRLGFADVDVVNSGKELKNVDTQEYIPLQDGRTLPIKFRIETGIAGQVIVTPDSASIPVGGTQQFTATVLDLHGNPLAASVTWSSSDPGVATVDGTGLATGVSVGQATITATAQGASGSATLTVFNPNTPPVANPDTFDAIGNVTVPVAAPGVLANDTDGESNPLSVVPGTFPTVAGGTVTLNADGSFSYLSAAGFTGQDSFEYTVTDGIDSATSTVTVISAYRVWYVDNSGAAPGDGRDASPFTTLKAAEAESTVGETIFLRYGNGTTAGYDEGIVLKTGQALTGQGVPANVTATLNGQTVVLLAAGNAPTVTRASGTTVQISTDNVIQGFDVGSADGAGIAGTGFGTLTVGSMSVAANGGPALDLSSGDVFGSFDGLSATTATGAGIHLLGIGGSFSAAGGTITVTGAATAGVDVTGGAGTFSYGGDVVATGPLAVFVANRTGGALTFGGTIASTGSGIGVQNNSGGTIAFNGASKTLSTGANPGVRLLNNTGASISFGGGGLVIGTSGATGFEATGGGTVTVTGAGNTVVAAGGTAVHLDGVSSGASGISFLSVSATGGTSGIVITDLGGAGFQTTGSGAVAGSGGVIQGTSGDAVSLSGAGTVHLRLMRVLPGASGIVASEFSGTAVVERSEIDHQGASSPGSFSVRVANGSANGAFTLDGTTVRNKLDATAAVAVSGAGGSALAFSVRDSDTGDAFPSEFTNLFGSAVLASSSDNAGVAVVVRDSRFVNAAPNGTNNLDLSATQSATLNYTIEDNLFDNVGRASAIAGVINLSTFDAGRLGSTTAGASITGNTIQNIGTGSSVAQLGYVGIRVALDNNVGGVEHRVLIADNTLTNLWRQGILVSSRNLVNDVNVRIQNNVVGTQAAPVARSNRRAVEIEAQASSAMKVEVLNNPSIVNTATSGSNSALHIRSIGSTSSVSATVLGNTIGNSSGVTTAGRFRTETVSGLGAQVCLDLRSNTLDAPSSLFELVAAGTGAFLVEGPGTAVVTGPDITAANVTGTGSVTGAPQFNNNANCAQPTL